MYQKPSSYSQKPSISGDSKGIQSNIGEPLIHRIKDQTKAFLCIEEGSTQYRYTLVSAQGEDIEVILTDNGADVKIKERFKLSAGEKYVFLRFSSLTKVNFLKDFLSTSFISPKEYSNAVQSEDGAGDVFVKELRPLFFEIGFNIRNVRGKGYEIGGFESSGNVKKEVKGVISARLKDDGISISLEEKIKNKKRSVEFNFGNTTIGIVFEYEQYIVFESLVKAYANKPVGWKIDRQRKGELVEQINDIFIKNDIPLWINAIYKKIVTRMGESTVPSGEYELSITSNKEKQ